MFRLLQYTLLYIFTANIWCQKLALAQIFERLEHNFKCVGRNDICSQRVDDYGTNSYEKYYRKPCNNYKFSRWWPGGSSLGQLNLYEGGVGNDNLKKFSQEKH